MSVALLRRRPAFRRGLAPLRSLLLLSERFAALAVRVPRPRVSGVCEWVLPTDEKVFLSAAWTAPVLGNGSSGRAAAAAFWTRRSPPRAPAGRGRSALRSGDGCGPGRTPHAGPACEGGAATSWGRVSGQDRAILSASKPNARKAMPKPATLSTCAPFGDLGETVPPGALARLPIRNVLALPVACREGASPAGSTRRE